MTKKSSNICLRLNSSQEEADTRLLLHAYDTSRDYEGVILVSHDTDIPIIAIGVSRFIPNLYLKRGSSNCPTYVDVDKLLKQLEMTYPMCFQRTTASLAVIPSVISLVEVKNLVWNL